MAILIVTAASGVTEACSVCDRHDAMNESGQKSSIIESESCSVMPKVVVQINRVVTSTLSPALSRYEQIFSLQDTRFDRDMVLLKLFAE